MSNVDWRASKYVYVIFAFDRKRSELAGFYRFIISSREDLMSPRLQDAEVFESFEKAAAIRKMLTETRTDYIWEVKKMWQIIQPIY